MDPLRKPPTNRRRRSTAAICALFTLALTLAPALSPGVHSPAAHASEAAWRSPLDGPLSISAYFDLPNGPYQAGHRGIDMPTRHGQAVRSPSSGVVSFVGTVVDRPLISIRVDEHTVLSIEPVASELREGDTVSPGDPIGTVAGGGHCRESCMHLGVRLHGNYVNPLRYLRQRPVLLPWQ